MEYHRLDRDEGLYYGLEQSGAMIGIPDEVATRNAVAHPPETTRALVRGKCIQKFPGAILSAQWDHVTLSGSAGPIQISLLNLFERDEVECYSKIIDAAKIPDDLRTLIGKP